MKFQSNSHVQPVPAQYFSNTNYIIQLESGASLCLNAAEYTIWQEIQTIKKQLNELIMELRK